MHISVIVFVTDVILFHETNQSIKAQSYKDYEIILLCPKGIDILIDDNYKKINLLTEGFYSTCNVALEQAKGNYILLLNSGDKLTNDRVLEEFVLNSATEDIIFGNTIICNDKSVADKYIFVPDNLRISDLSINELPVQCIFFKRQLIINLKGFDVEFSEEAARFYCIDAIFNKHATCRHINYFVSTITDCKINVFELKNGLNKYLPSLAEDMMEIMQNRIRNDKESTKLLYKIEKSWIFKRFLKVRKFAEDKGFYDLKARWKQKRYYKKITQRDESIRKEVERKIWTLAENLLTRNNDASDIIVSLTSFGHRVADSAPYAIYTLFTQKQLPNRIILFLDHDNWNSTNIPALLQKLQKSGLEIMFCEDIRPYKKLIPAMRLFPENTIITVDDDVYYNENTIAELLYSYEKSDKKTVICHWAFIAEQRNGKFIPYSQWKDNVYGNHNSFLSPVGQDGVLYPARVFDEEMLKSDVFMKLCTGDDIWFWIQEYRKNINVQLVPKSSKHHNTFVNTVDQWAPTQKSALYYLNVIEGRNDINLRNLLDNYGIE
jgi:hypothetical protein